MAIRSDDISHDLFLYAVEQFKLHNKDDTIDISIIKEEYNRFWFVLKLLAVYKNNNELNVRLLLNHLIILTNIFEIGAVNILLGISIDRGDYEIISNVMTILSFIGYVSEEHHFYILEEEYLLTDVPLNPELLKKLEQGIYNVN